MFMNSSMKTFTVHDLYGETGNAIPQVLGLYSLVVHKKCRSVCTMATGVK